MKKGITIQITAFCIFCSLTGGAQINRLGNRVKEVIDSTYKALIKKYKVVGSSIAIVDNGNIVYATGYGFSDRENKIAASEKTVYRIGSCTKSFTALSILQLQQKGKLAIKNSVRDYLPELKIKSRYNDNNELYINEMMSHVSGLPGDILNGFFCDAPPTIAWEIEELNKQTTASPRRYKHAYSNVAYGLLGEVIARTSKSSYSEYVKENIFKPLNMTSSFIDYDEELGKKFSKAYISNKRIKEPLIRDAAAGLIHSSVEDMANYVSMFLKNGTFNNTSILNPESIKLMEQNQIDDIYLSNKESWGYGLYSAKVLAKKEKDSSVVTLIGHAGDTYAFHSDFGFIPELNIGVVVLTNTDNGARMRSAAKLLKIYAKEAMGKVLNYDYNEPTSAAVDANKGNNCSRIERLGTYNFGEFVMRVKNPKKIKFKQGPATVVLTEKKNDSNFYSVKAKLFGVIPFKVKGQAFRFAKKENTIYCKGVSTKSGNEDFIGVKSSPMSIPDNWKVAFGKYEAASKVYACTNCNFMNPDGMKVKLGESKGILYLETTGKTPDLNGKTYFDVQTNDLAKSGGIGRGTGETLRILENGNLYYSGFEFKKVK